MLATLLAVGIDPKRSIVFHQDDVSLFTQSPVNYTYNVDKNPDHVELSWILSCMTSMGKMSRMTSWKVRLLSYFECNSD